MSPNGPMFTLAQQALLIFHKELSIKTETPVEAIVIPSGKSSSISARVKQHSGGGGGTQHGARQLKLDI
jgi:hypothetical protein